nr:hypothetical protein [Acanthella acuta]
MLLKMNCEKIWHFTSGEPEVKCFAGKYPNVVWVLPGHEPELRSGLKVHVVSGKIYFTYNIKIVDIMDFWRFSEAVRGVVKHLETKTDVMYSNIVGLMGPKDSDPSHDYGVFSSIRFQTKNNPKLYNITSYMFDRLKALLEEYNGAGGDITDFMIKCIPLEKRADGRFIKMA